MKIFAERLKALRKEDRRTSKEMAEFLEISQRAYLYYESETNFPDIPRLIKLADFFNVTIDYLVGRSEER